MLHFSFHLQNPWNKYSSQGFRNLCYVVRTLSKHKSISLEVLYQKHMLAEFELSIVWRGRDHAGPEISLGLLRYAVRVNLYDHRHWDDASNDWYTPSS